MTAPYVKNMLNLTRMQFTEPWMKSCRVRKGLSFSSAGGMEAEEHGGNTSSPEKQQAMLTPPVPCAGVALVPVHSCPLLS